MTSPATLLSRIESLLDTLGQSERLSPQQKHTLVLLRHELVGERLAHDRAHQALDQANQARLEEVIAHLLELCATAQITFDRVRPL